MYAIVKTERKRGRKYAKIRTSPKSRREAKRKRRNPTAASPPASHRNRGCKVTGGVQHGAAMKNKKNKKEQRPILDPIRAREKKRGEEELPWCCGQRRREPACCASATSVRGERAVAASACTERAAARCYARWRRRRQEEETSAERGKIAPPPAPLFINGGGDRGRVIFCTRSPGWHVLHIENLSHIIGEDEWFV